MDILRNIPEYLRSTAISLAELGVNNCAWSERDTLEVISWLTKRDFAVLGGDVLKLVEGQAIQSTYDSWYLNKRPEWLWSEYVKYSGNHARDYISSYTEANKEQNVVFSLVIANERQFEELISKSS